MKIGIVGLGLIGGSLGLDLRSLGHQVLGVSRSQQTCRRAIERGAVDDASVDIALMARAEVVFVCTPIEAIAPTILQLKTHLSPSAIITDVGSVKMLVVTAVKDLWHNFVPGHPMAGSAESGIEAAQNNLFVGRPYAIATTQTTPEDASEVIEEIARSLSAKIIKCSPSLHDRAVALISHLPVMTSASLIETCMQESDEAAIALAKQLASSGFRDTSRVGGGNPELGVMMAQYNRQELLRALDAYRQQIDRSIDYIKREDWAALKELLQQTQLSRPQFLKKTDCDPSSSGQKSLK
ncbi:MAG: prephenate/arogenate dehydrogenase [Oscillatoria sp. SIO1A7]|nr:prephenate/arogenate dehydrogenase [Oscillatoria sp. SIO1A7]